jgi:hypothetical protein
MDQHFYLGIVGVDDKGNEGKMSNLARVFIDSSHVKGLSVPQQNKVSVLGPHSTGTDEAVMIGVLCGTFLVIALLLWAGIWYIRRHRRTGQSGKSGTKKSGVNANLVNGHDTSSSDIDSVHNNKNNLVSVPQFSTIASGGGPIGSYPHQIHNNNDDITTPTYWSASKLLEEHEQRIMMERAAEQQRQQLSR